MIIFENNRLNYLNTRNIDLGEKEKGLGSNLHCRNQNEEYEEAYREIAKIMLESRNDKNYIDYKNFIEENQINIQDDKLIAIKNKLGTRRESIANENDTISELNKQKVFSDNSIEYINELYEQSMLYSTIQFIYPVKNYKPDILIKLIKNMVNLIL